MTDVHNLQDPSSTELHTPTPIPDQIMSFFDYNWKAWWPEELLPRPDISTFVPSGSQLPCVGKHYLMSTNQVETGKAIPGARDATPTRLMLAI